MSQNDFNLANQGFAAMRSDMNSALQALASNSSGAIPPPTTYAYQWWYETTENKLKIRNAANADWIDFAMFNQASGTFSITTANIFGLNATVAELNQLVGVSSPIQPQLMRAGSVFYFAGQTAPEGSVKANGAAVLRSSFADLDAAIYCGASLNATALFGYRATTNVNPSANRSTSGTYIVLPDMRAEFPRGWDDARGVDTGRLFGSAQSDMLAAHQHTLTILAGTGSNIGGYAAYTGSGTAKYIAETAGGVETRPRNIALLACIKY